jgi:zinc-ribbon family
MLIIFGLRSFERTLAMLTLVCGRCRNAAAHRLVQRRRWFTLFFIPLVPLGTTRYTVCAYCGAAHKVAKADAKTMLTGGDVPAKATEAGWRGAVREVRSAR